MTEPGMTFQQARYAGRQNGKPQVAIVCQPDGSGNKTRAMRLCSALRARWSNRERAYIASPAKAAKIKALFESGRDARLGDRRGVLGWMVEEKNGTDV